MTSCGMKSPQIWIDRAAGTLLSPSLKSIGTYDMVGQERLLKLV